MEQQFEMDSNREAVVTAQQSETARLAILFADIGGSTALYQRVGDAIAHQMIMDGLNTMRTAVEEAGGELLRTVGDAVLASFDSCDSACVAAKNMHKAFSSNPLDVRIGFHWGDAISDQGDVYGNAVNIAARVSGLANTGEIMVTKEVVDRLSEPNRADSHLLDKISVKGVDEPLEIHRLQWQDPDADHATMVFTKPFTHDVGKVRHFNLALSYGNQQVSLSSDGDSCAIGRGEDSDLVTAHDAASRIHATIERKQSKFVLTDRSTNGTYVSKNGQPAVFIHRDSYNLDGSGVIAIGFMPDNATGKTHGLVKFKVGVS
ncbi:hypothetical protein AB833_08420 [Chromatiales bacterium (ex Bugula neritina AB1)]|nr:hypothetical protein AB833_08420 [Chromatiales bacterium (ex Bugula neritina AB1)]